MTATLAEPLTPVRTSSVSTWQRRHFAIFGGLGLLQMLIRAEMPQGQDMLFNARYGLDFLATGTLPRTDTYSWSFHGHEWIPSSWAWNILLALAYRAAGVIGFWLVGVAISVAMAIVTARLCAAMRIPPVPAAAVYAPIGLLALAVVPRAQTVSALFVVALPALTAATLLSCGRARWRAVAVLCLVQIVWMNVHSLALIGPVLVLACGGALLVGRRMLTARNGAFVLMLAALLGACCAATPYGLTAIRHASDVRATSAGLVREWAPVGFGSVAQEISLGAVILAVPLAVSAWRRGRYSRAAAMLLLAAATATAIRFGPMLALLAAPEMAWAVSKLRVRERMFRVTAVSTALVLAGIAVLGARDLRSVGPTVSPGLIAQLPPSCRLLNDDMAGSAVTLLRRDVPVALDGRTDLYGRHWIQLVESMFADRRGTDQLLRQFGISCVLGPKDAQLVRRLGTTPGWHVAGTDELRSLVVRQ
jgi:hypothetical protein